MGINKSQFDLELNREPVGNKVFRGGFNYFRGNNIYSDEEFEVWRDPKELSMSFFSRLSARTQTGEFLKIYVDYQVTKDFVPTTVLIERNLGKQTVSENYTFDKKQSMLTYDFKNGDEFKTTSMQMGGGFHITTPTTATSMLFTKNRQSSEEGQRYFPLVRCYNSWTYEETPLIGNIIFQKMGTGGAKVDIDGKNLPATEYKLLDDLENSHFEEERQSTMEARVWVSNFVGIPYLIQTNDSTKIQIKYLNNLDQD